MSTGADCCFIKEPKGWYYLIQCWPYGETEKHDKNGPFATFEKAYKHMSNNYPNPGGYWIEEQKE